MNFFQVLVATFLLASIPITSSKRAFARHPPHHQVETKTCIMMRHSDTAQCFNCDVFYRNGKVSYIANPYGQNYPITVGDSGWINDNNDGNCVVNNNTGQKYCVTRC